MIALTDRLTRADAVMNHIDLGVNARLEELHIFGLINCAPDDEPVPPPLTVLTSLLASVRSPMQVLSLALYPADRRALARIDFAGLARLLSQPGHVWGRIREVRIVVASGEGSSLETFVRQRLWMLEQRGVLRVGAGFDDRENV